MDKAQLLPCPFCGGAPAHGTVRYANSTVREQDWTQDTFHFINCTSCGSSNVGMVGKKTPDDAALAWNRRTPLPPSASGERDRLLAQAFENIGNLDAEELRRRLDAASNSALAIAMRGEPSPGIDAAEQKPVAWITSDRRMLVFADTIISDGDARHSGMTPLYAAPPAAQPDAEWEQKAERLARAFAEVKAHHYWEEGRGTSWRRLERLATDLQEADAALLAHLRTKP